MSAPTTIHRPAGVPEGGQFAGTARHEPLGVELDGGELDGAELDTGSVDLVPADAPRQPDAREPEHDLGPDPQNQLTARLGELHNIRQYADYDVQALHQEAHGDVDVMVATINRAAREEFERMCAVVDAVRAGLPASSTRTSALYPEHLGYRELHDWEKTPS